MSGKVELLPREAPPPRVDRPLTPNEVDNAVKRVMLGAWERQGKPQVATDDDLDTIISAGLGIQGSSCGPGRVAVSHRGGTRPAIWASWAHMIPEHHEEEPNTTKISGKRALRAAVRRAFGIARPGDVPAPATEAPQPPTRLERHLAERFAGVWRAGVAAFVECGEVLGEARDALPHGRWEAWVDEQLPIGPRSARQLVRIAGDPNIRRFAGKSAHAAVLPPDRTALEALCGVDPDIFDALVERG